MFGLFKRKPAPRVRPQKKPRVTVIPDPLGKHSDRWVPAIKRAELPVAPINANVGHTIDVSPNSQAKIDFKTSAVDRAWGFLIASVPLYASFAGGVLVVAAALWSVPILSFTALVIFWLSFVAAWLAGYAYTLAVSAEGVMFFEALQKWQVIKEEQRLRWEYYDQLTGGDDSEP